MSCLLWILILAAVVGILYYRQKRENKMVVLECGDNSIPAGDAIAVADDAELMAVIMAAVAELEGTSEFHVLSVKASSTNWRLTGRQELMASRL